MTRSAATKRPAIRATRRVARAVDLVCRVLRWDPAERK
jgi:hypothetical protein